MKRITNKVMRKITDWKILRERKNIQPRKKCNVRQFNNYNKHHLGIHLTLHFALH